MIPYFYHLEKQLFTSSFIDDMETYIKRNLDQFVSYVGSDGEADGNNYHYSKELKEIPEIKSFMEGCSLASFPMIVLHKPFSKVIKHIDDPNKRNTVIIIPVYPKSGYAPTYFWHKQSKIATCEFSRGDPVLFNTQKLHSLDNESNEYRCNLQICFDEDFETVLKLYQNHMLFKE